MKNVWATINVGSFEVTSANPFNKGVETKLRTSAPLGKVNSTYMICFLIIHSEKRVGAEFLLAYLGLMKLEV